MSTMPLPSPDDLDRSAERETRMDRDDSREPRVAIKRVINDADRAELLALNFRSAFVRESGGAE